LTTGSVGGALLVIVLFLVGAAVKAIVGQEAKGRSKDLASFFVNRAVDRLPAAYRAEKRDEWTAELYQLRDKPLSALRFSWRLYRLRSMTAHELRAESAASSPPRLDKAVSQPLSLDELHPRLRAAIESLHDLGWRDVIEAMHDPTLWHVDEGINAATARFVAMIGDTRLPLGGAETAKLMVRLSDAIDPRVRRSYATGKDSRSVPPRVKAVEIADPLDLSDHRRRPSTL
jgi:hypothetical protein